MENTERILHGLSVKQQSIVFDAVYALAVSSARKEALRLRRADSHGSPHMLLSIQVSFSLFLQNAGAV